VARKAKKVLKKLVHKKKHVASKKKAHHKKTLKHKAHAHHRKIKTHARKAKFIKSKAHRTSHVAASKDAFIKMVNRGSSSRFEAFKKLAAAHRVLTTASNKVRMTKAKAYLH